jgi:hypothetical protein
MPTETKQTPAQAALSEFISKRFDSLARDRWAESREWAQAGYFDQLKQWLEEDQQSKRLRPMKPKEGQKWPMPVTNHFSKTISTNANSLGAGIPEMLALSDNYDARNRRAAEAAGNAIDAANRESGMEILNPTLARQTVLWGLGVTEDSIAFDGTVEVPTIADPQEQAEEQTEAQPQQPEGEILSPESDVNDTPNVTGTQRVPTPRLKTTLLTVFQVYLPRDAQDPNLAKSVYYWKPLPLGEARETYPDFADDFQADNGPEASADAYYLRSLQSLSYSGSKAKDSQGEETTIYCAWLQWSELPKDVAEKLKAEWQNQPSGAYPELDKLTAAMQYGLYVCLGAGKKVIEWGENPWEGDCTLTFFPWQKDVASAYPKGLSAELVPLQKQLNRVDSLMERALMSNATVKLLAPNTQTGTLQASGDPVEIYWYDNLGEGKVKPEFFGGHAYGRELIQKREQIVADFKELGFSNSVAEGEMPGSGTAFRALAYLGAKAEETRKTQRYLWEQSHELRARKIVRMAMKAWDEPRKVQTAGFNNKFGMSELQSADLQGDYSLNVIQDSSRPKTMTEKLEAFQMLVQGGFVNPQDVSAREYLLDTLGLTELDLADHLQFAKAERDLQKLINGIQPMESPFQKWDIYLMIFSQYTLTEEFEALPDANRHGILMYTQYISEKLTVAKGGMLPGQAPPLGLPAPPADPKAGPGGQTASHVLGQVPGQTVSPSQTQIAATREAADVVPNSPSPTA